MAKPRSKIIDLLQYVGLRWVHMSMHCWPVEWNLAFARGVGEVLYRVDAKHRKRSRSNIKRSFPDMPDDRVEHMAKESVKGLISLGVEVMFTTRLVRLDTFSQCIELTSFRDTLDILLKKHNGLILLTGHYGNWEILGYVLAVLGFETVSVARPLDNPYLNAWVMGVREKKGQRIVGKKGATDEVTDTLNRQGMVGFTADQDAGKKGIFVDFFGRKASTYKSIGILAMRYNVPVVIGYARRVPGKFRFKLGSQDVIRPEDWKDHDKPLEYITQRYTKAIEDFVRDDPGQYLWVHRRWKTRPKGEEPETYD